MWSRPGLCDVLAPASASVLKMLPSVAGVEITACIFDPAPLWLCAVITAYVLNLRSNASTVATCIETLASLEANGAFPPAGAVWLGMNRLGTVRVSTAKCGRGQEAISRTYLSTPPLGYRAV
jgi:hypothetical protein